MTDTRSVMDEIDQQIQTLINQAPQDGTTPGAIMAIAPALKLIAGQLKHPQYYVLQTLEQNWVMTTLAHRTQTNVSKNVIRAFSTVKDATADSLGQTMQVIAVSIPVTHILFQIVAMAPVHSIVFFENPGNFSNGTEISRSMIQDQIQRHLKQLKRPAIPHDIA